MRQPLVERQWRLKCAGDGLEMRCTKSEARRVNVGPIWSVRAFTCITRLISQKSTMVSNH
jgi:hypothetical protein